MTEEPETLEEVLDDLERDGFLPELRLALDADRACAETLRLARAH